MKASYHLLNLNTKVKIPKPLFFKKYICFIGASALTVTKFSITLGAFLHPALVSMSTLEK